jgi:hypothetical protein
VEKQPDEPQEEEQYWPVSNKHHATNQAG